MQLGVPYGRLWCHMRQRTSDLSKYDDIRGQSRSRRIGADEGIRAGRLLAFETMQSSRKGDKERSYLGRRGALVSRIASTFTPILYDI